MTGVPVKSFNYKGRSRNAEDDRSAGAGRGRRRFPVQPPRSRGSGLFHVKRWLRRRRRSPAIRRLSLKPIGAFMPPISNKATTSLRAGYQGNIRERWPTPSGGRTSWGHQDDTVTAPNDTPVRRGFTGHRRCPAAIAGDRYRPNCQSAPAVAPGAYAPSNLDISKGIIKNESGGNLNVRDSPQGADWTWPDHAGDRQAVYAAGRGSPKPCRQFSDSLIALLPITSAAGRPILRGSLSPISPVRAMSPSPGISYAVDQEYSSDVNEEQRVEVCRQRRGWSGRISAASVPAGEGSSVDQTELLARSLKDGNLGTALAALTQPDDQRAKARLASVLAISFNKAAAPSGGGRGGTPLPAMMPGPARPTSCQPPRAAADVANRPERKQTPGRGMRRSSARRPARCLASP